MKKRGFTLVEISVALVVIGLVIIGILAGQDLIRQYKVRKIISKYDDYIGAISAFHIKFNALAGDFKRASNYWPAAFNGNGDGLIDQVEEPFYIWQHLALAEVITGSYNGVEAIPCNPGVNVPELGIDDEVVISVPTDADGAVVGVPGKNYFAFGKSFASCPS
jgi:prepilin-type N-terminal cleavage/methylation domain-containing protein